ncbi:MAG: acyl carrier protein [Thermoguttaceae bacterium]|jgi:acyl carrier protein
MNDIPRRLAKCFAAAFPQLAPERIPQASTESIPQWDSLALVVLTSLVEEEFKIQISPNDLDYFVSYERILAYLQKNVVVP